MGERREREHTPSHPTNPRLSTRSPPHPPFKESRETLARLKRMAGFEAQDFDPPEHDVERTFRAHRTEREYGAEEAWRWALAAAIGVAMGVCGFAVDWGIGALNDVKFRRADEAIAASGGGFWRPAAVFIGTSAGFGAVAGGLVSFVSPLAAGSGIAEIKTYLNGIHIRGLLTVRGRERERERHGGRAALPLNLNPTSSSSPHHSSSSSHFRSARSSPSSPASSSPSPRAWSPGRKAPSSTAARSWAAAWPRWGRRR